jgi:hypothetical protein
MNGFTYIVLQGYILFFTFRTPIFWKFEFGVESDAPPSSLLDPKRVQLCERAEVVETWCCSQLPTLKGGERGVLKAPRLD